MLGDDGLAMERNWCRAGPLLLADLRCRRYSAGQDDRRELVNILTLQAARDTATGTAKRRLSRLPGAVYGRSVPAPGSTPCPVALW